ncbi:2,3-bisphosphoglycerate-dependent phosphoglycerate mutase [Senna tora]|uniref:2,3-bisphosphoglycerate-dependent phosphoglycerate mutase n=1 Tax=Senna tora TaxID=362788 RepID=A0A834SEC8_9FABA|nr:2,3-bisphosphoglycerate-dependent phosphoglycerate mutase [Senna tora]
MANHGITAPLLSSQSSNQVVLTLSDNDSNRPSAQSCVRNDNPQFPHPYRSNTGETLVESDNPFRFLGCEDLYVSSPTTVKPSLMIHPTLMGSTSASPLSPQLSSLGTPRLGPSIKVWDPYNVLATSPVFSKSFSANAMYDDQTVTEVFLISHGECELNSRPDLIWGRCKEAALTQNGKRQARAMAVFLKSQGIRFNAVYSSPLDRARLTAVSVCKEINFSEESIQSSDALADMSNGNWEGCLCSEIYTPEVLRIIDSFQPDFTAPSGESLRQVEFRMIHFLNGTILGFPEKLRLDLPSHQNDNQAFMKNNSDAPSSSIHDQDAPSLHPNQWDSLNSHRLAPPKKKSSKSRLQVVTKTEDVLEEETSPSEVNRQSGLRNSSFSNCSASVSCVGVFTHSVPIKCLLPGLLGCSPLMSHRICIEDSSMTVLQHSLRTGWQIRKLNDTAHLRLL